MTWLYKLPVQLKSSEPLVKTSAEILKESKTLPTYWRNKLVVAVTAPKGMFDSANTVREEVERFKVSPLLH
jgi:hypothetical protein